MVARRAQSAIAENPQEEKVEQIRFYDGGRARGERLGIAAKGEAGKVEREIHGRPSDNEGHRGQRTWDPDFSAVFAAEHAAGDLRRHPLLDIREPAAE